MNAPDEAVRASLNPVWVCITGRPPLVIMSAPAADRCSRLLAVVCGRERTSALLSLPSESGPAENHPTQLFEGARSHGWSWPKAESLLRRGAAAKTDKPLLIEGCHKG